MTLADPPPSAACPPGPLRPAPLAGQQTREVAARLLHLTAAQTQALLDDGVLEEPAGSAPAAPPAATALREPR